MDTEEAEMLWHHSPMVIYPDAHDWQGGPRLGVGKAHVFDQAGRSYCGTTWMQYFTRPVSDTVDVVKCSRCSKLFPDTN